MMSDSDHQILRALISADALVPAESDGYGKSILILEEHGSPNRYSLKIRNVPDNVLAIKADQFPEPKFQGSRGERKRADFIIVAVAKTKKWIVHVELKAGDKPSKEVMQQLKGAQCLLVYCRVVGQTFWQQKDFLDQRKYQQRFVSVARISMNKKPTRWRRVPEVHDTPEKMLRINSPANGTLRFSSLVGKDADAV